MFVIKTNRLHYSMNFASLFLYVVIILTRQIKCISGCSLESVDMVKKSAIDLRNKETHDCMLYTPTLADFETTLQDVNVGPESLQNCSKSTLICFALEVEVLKVEIQSVSRLHQLGRILYSLTRKLEDKRNSCPVCELYREESAQTFLETLQNILERMNAKNC